MKILKTARCLLALVLATLAPMWTLSCDDDKEPWQCWIGSGSPTESNYCTCYRSKLEPYEGSPEIGASCAESTSTDFLCCVFEPAYDACTCYYATDPSAFNAADLDERNCGAGVTKVSSCPPP